MRVFLVILAGAWVGAVLKLEAQGIGIFDLRLLIALLLSLPALLVPYFGTIPHVTSWLTKVGFTWYVAGAVAGVSILAFVLQHLSLPAAVLLVSPLFQLIILRTAYVYFLRRLGRVPADVQPPGFWAGGVLPFAIECTQHPFPDRAYIGVVTLVSVIPVFLALVVHGA